MKANEVRVTTTDRDERFSFPHTSTHQTILMVVINHPGYSDEELRRIVDLEAMYAMAEDHDLEDWQTVVV